VSATTSSVFRQEQQYLHAGDLSHNFGQNPQKQFRNRLQKNKEKTYNSTTISVNSQQQPITPNKRSVSIVTVLPYKPNSPHQCGEFLFLRGSK